MEIEVTFAGRGQKELFDNGEDIRGSVTLYAMMSMLYGAAHMYCPPLALMKNLNHFSHRDCSTQRLHDVLPIPCSLSVQA